ncbi:MAG: hypothetical protein JSS63_15005 [Bacteroidetes bacterium]|nr:hypothetical protein [Bacteroidota bacterium]
MPKRSAERNYNTHLASEYLMMSLFNRIGLEAYLSLGNKKGVDIIVKTSKNSLAVIEVKGVSKKSDDWIICNTGTFPSARNLFYALISFDGKINDINIKENLWLINSETIVKMEGYKISKNNKTVYISNKVIREKFNTYKNNFNCLIKYLGEH